MTSQPALGSLYYSRFGMDVIRVRIATCSARQIIWGVSDNTRRGYSLTEAEAVGYAELFADEVTETAPPDHVGGHFTTTPLGVLN